MSGSHPQEFSAPVNMSVSQTLLVIVMYNQSWEALT